MSLNTDKRKINYLIACGYCLVVIIILFNYLRTPRKNKNYREGTRASHQTQELNQENNELEKQLKEQKRMNDEMREMLIDINKAKQVNSVKNYEVLKKEELQPVVVAKNPNKPIKNINPKSYELPDISSDVGKKFKDSPAYPFEENKNPFAVSEAVSETINNEDGLSFHGQNVICNPIVPYMFSSSNSDFNLISNY